MVTYRYKYIDEFTVEPIDFDSAVSYIKQEYESTLIAKNLQDEVIKPIFNKKKKSRNEELLLQYRQSVENDFSIKIETLKNTYLPLVETLQPEVDEFDILIPIYENVDSVIVRNWQIRKNDYCLITNKINSLKQELSSSDFKIVKAYENVLMGEEMDKEVLNIVKNRRKIRGRINELLEKINNQNV